MRRAPLCFSAAGCRVETDVLFCAVLSLLLWWDPGGAFGWCAAAAALHELGHVAALRLLGYFPFCLRLTAFGVRLRYEGTAAHSYRRDFWVSVSGPLLNMLLFLLLLAAGRLLPGELQPRIRVPAGTQLALGAFNLLPIEPLDGGQALQALLRQRFSPETAQRIGNGVTVLLLFPLAAAGFLVLLRSRGNYSLLLLAGYLTALFVLKQR